MPTESVSPHEEKHFRFWRRWQTLVLLLSLLLILSLSLVRPAAQVVSAAPGADMQVSLVSRIPNAASYPLNTGFGIRISVQNISATAQAEAGTVVVTDNIPAQLTYVGFTSAPGNIFTCTAAGQVVTCVNDVVIPPASAIEDIGLGVVGTTAGNNIVNSAFLTVTNGDDTNFGNNSGTDTPFSIVAPTNTPTITLTPSQTLTPSLTPVISLTPSASPSPTLTVTPSLTLLPSITPLPTITPTLTATFIPPPPTRTPLPRPANAGQAIPIPLSGVDAVVNRDSVNVRLLPALGAEVIGFVNAETLFEDIEARSPDNEWVRVNFLGEQAWIGTAVLTLLAGDYNALPVADPRTIPYGGWENPRAGLTAVTGTYTVRLPTSGLRLRSGPGRGYVVLANPPRYSVMPLLGITRDRRWIQVNFEGTLGWVAVIDLEVNDGTAFDIVPIDGIVADALPFSDDTNENYEDTLRLLLARIDGAQPSLDAIRAIFQGVATGGAAACTDFPARPSDYNIPNPLRAAFNGTLGPLSTDFNRAVSLIRQSIDLLIEACSFTQPSPGSIGAGTVSIALQNINDADGLVSSLRERLLQLIPDDREPTEFECRFTFNGQSEIVPRLVTGYPIIVDLDRDDFVYGFCFDATVGQSFRIEGLVANGSVQSPQIAVSTFTNPTNFISVGQLSPDADYFSILTGAVAATGQYLVVLSDLNFSPPPDGQLAILLTDLTIAGASTGRSLGFDAQGNVVVNPTLFSTPVAPPGFVPPPVNAVTCPSLTFTCQQFLTCAEAQACLAAGNRSLDANSNGVPCEETVCAIGAVLPTATRIQPPAGE